MAQAQIWIDVLPESHFSIANIPFGVYKTEHDPLPRCCSRVGDHVLDLKGLTAEDDLLSESLKQSIGSTLSQQTLNSFANLGRKTVQSFRVALQELFVNPEREAQVRRHMIPATEACMLLPMHVSEFTDFLTSKEHAYNAAKVMFRGNTSMIKMPPAFFTQPIGYHGRASSVVVSGSDIYRPTNSSLNKQTDEIEFAPTRALDYEVELGYFLCGGNERGQPIKVQEAENHIFGVVLVNDWSARDHQGFEMVPLGPFNAKNFSTSISPWIVTLDALEAFRCDLPAREGDEAPHLKDSRARGINIQIGVYLNENKISQVSSEALYFAPAQLIAHHSVGGCPMRNGDLLATGTISVEVPNAVGCLLEATEGGMSPLNLNNGNEKRTYLEDNDIVRFVGVAGREDSGVGFGECTGRIVCGS